MYDSVRGKMVKVDCIRVNVDYESVLFHGRSGPPVMNQALEFLAFYLQDFPVLTTKKYSPEFLEKVRNLSGRNPATTGSGNARNWWGPLENPEREMWMNSKLTSFRLSLSQGWTEGGIYSRDQLLYLSLEVPSLIKDPFNMSGKGIIAVSPGENLSLPGALSGELILEPLLERKYDFSHFIFPDGKMICYENLVDEKFQYRGTRFPSMKDFTVQSLSFYKQLSPEKWEEFLSRLGTVRSHYGDPSPYGYSVDSFVYEKNGDLLIHPLCEVNARRTMGSVAFELAKKLGQGQEVALTLKKPLFKNSILLSPENVRFEIYLSFE